VAILLFPYAGVSLHTTSSEIPATHCAEPFWACIDALSFDQVFLVVAHGARLTINRALVAVIIFRRAHRCFSWRGTSSTKGAFTISH
jgi:hypothetical protein